jgi:hypothetical protein
MTDVALGTGEGRHQLRVTARDPPTRALLIGGQPLQNPRLESGKTHGRHGYAPDTRGAAAA